MLELTVSSRQYNPFSIQFFANVVIYINISSDTIHVKFGINKYMSYTKYIKRLNLTPHRDSLVADAQRTQTDFCRKQLREKLEVKGPIFYRTESAHTERFFIADNMSEGKVRFFIGVSICAYEPIFTPIFCDKNRPVCGRH